MTPSATSWRPYRLGVLAAILGWASGLFLVVWLFRLLLHDQAVPFWPLIPAAVIGSVTARLMDYRYSPIRCPDCRKPVFRQDGGPSAIGGRVGGSLFWPERECSQCGYGLDGPVHP